MSDLPDPVRRKIAKLSSQAVNKGYQIFYHAQGDRMRSTKLVTTAQVAVEMRKLAHFIINGGGE